MAESSDAAPSSTQQLAPHPGWSRMPRWDLGELIDAPRFTWRNWFALLGPGLLMGGASIGGGEWLTGPAVTARYGAGLMWLATLSILAQVVYNIEISRYTLYTGEPIFTGKFRTLPGPRFWLFVYLLLDFGSFFPYLAANAATPLATMYLGHVPTAEDIPLQRGISYGVFLLAITPMVFGGKIYDTLKGVMTFKIFAVLGFLLLLALFETSWHTWSEIGKGFVSFGTVPIQQEEDANGNGVLDPGEDWDGDGHLDVIEPRLPPTLDSNRDGRPDQWTDLDGDGKPDKFVDIDGDGVRDGDSVANLPLAFFEGRTLPKIDFTMIAILAAFAAIAGSGGLTNAPISNYTRDQGWGMGYHVGAIPSVFGGHNLQLSHVGMVFPVTAQSFARWRRWVRHVVRDQMVVWMPACFVGIALPSMLSLQFLRRGTEADRWTMAVMTAGGVREQVGHDWGAMAGTVVWYMTLLCGFLVLAPSMATTIDGFLRRWVDVVWTSSERLRGWDTKHIKKVYAFALVGYTCLGLIMLWLEQPTRLLTVATNIMNFALGFSCWHTLVVNMILLPKQLRPNWFMRIGLLLSGLFFFGLATITAVHELGAWFAAG